MNFADLKLILVPTDFSASSEVALRAAVQFAKAFHADIEVFHVDVDPSIVLPPPLDTLTLPRLFERVVAETSTRLEAVVAEVRKAGVTCTSAEEFGRSYAAIVERARVAKAGLIVMGHHGPHALFAGVAEKVVQHAPCAVLVVPGAPPA
jgi:nucleotide-binding universal stress UspA family protein